MAAEGKEGWGKMKKNVWFIIYLLIGSAISHQTAQADNIKTYRDQALGFEVSYLENWEQARSPSNPAFFLKRKSVQEPGTISFHVAGFTGNKDLFLNEIRSNPQKFIEKYKQRFPSAEMIENGDTYLGGFPAYFITTGYELKNLNFEMEIVAIQIFCIKEKTIYLINFETPLLLFEKTFNEFQTILATFNFR